MPGYKAKIDFLNFKKGDPVSDEQIEKYPHWRSFVDIDKPKPDEFDLNEDGVVDKQDKKIFDKGYKERVKKRK